MNIKRKGFLTLMLILLISLAVTGCANNTDGDTPKDNTNNVIDDTKDKADDAVKDLEDDVRDMTYEDIKVTPEEAFDKFMELHPNAKINQVDLDKELMEYQYVVEGYDDKGEYEVKINPVDGKVISDDTDDSDVDNEKGEITKEHLSKIESIIDKAKKEDASDSRLDEWNISIEDGKVVMDVEIGATEYSYDMETEELIK